MRDFECEGVIHVHSIYSDGSGTIEEIMQAATELGLDFVIVTDHNTLKARADGYEGYYFNDQRHLTLCLISYEANDIYDQNHYLALGVSKTVHKRKPASDYVEAVREAGGFGVIAHPHERREAFEKYPPFPWTEWSANFDGIEIWNQMSEWAEGWKPENRFRRVFHPLASVTAPPKETLELWDKVNQERKVIAIGGVDAHAHEFNLLGLTIKIFPYKVCFRSIRTHALLREPIDATQPIEQEREKIYEALREGRSFISNSYLGAAKGFRFWATRGAETIEMGDAVWRSDEPIRFQAIAPRECAIRLIRNGRIEAERQGDRLDVATSEAGVYRVECHLNQKAWIFSNAIRVVAT
ncbi:MAG: CehA/McbA family metallohydrolase [Chloroherpetonaceae bacterium]|nr:CehA/McbA family metallohydrolase [Chloroherpetonaceae bacterium]MDW8437608.1 CehA/McbA family metallohydrolase [Chloroherpetonaceae bacterium]